MSIFEKIDSSLLELSNRLNAKLTKDRPSYPQALRNFEERRIDWIDDEVHKAIIIQPNFEHSGVNSKLWNFTILAWFDDIEPHKFCWISKIIQEQKFDTIENDIESLLKMSEDTLVKITKRDLM